MMMMMMMVPFWLKVAVSPQFWLVGVGQQLGGGLPSRPSLAAPLSAPCWAPAVSRLGCSAAVVITESQEDSGQQNSWSFSSSEFRKLTNQTDKLDNLLSVRPPKKRPASPQLLLCPATAQTPRGTLCRKRWRIMGRRRVLLLAANDPEGETTSRRS